MIVDSTPTAQAPPSTTAAIRPARPSSTCAARVGLTRPEGLADGAASGPPNARSTPCATGCAGTRIATVGRSAVTSARQPRIGPQRQHQRQRPRPERRRQGLGPVVEHGQPARRCDVRHVHDQRIEAGPPLGREDPRHGKIGPRIAAQAHRPSRSGRRQVRPPRRIAPRASSPSGPPSKSFRRVCHVTQR